jgi:hypothetical protein
MSHIDICKVEIRDLEALRSAAKVFGGEVVKKPTYNWYGVSVGDYPLPPGMTVDQLGKCEYAIQLPGVKYEVGVVKKKNGAYTLAWDFFGSDTKDWDPNDQGWHHDGEKLKAKFGDKCCHLACEYSKYATINSARRAGMFVTTKKLANGEYDLILQKA